MRPQPQGGKLLLLVALVIAGAALIVGSASAYSPGDATTTPDPVPQPNEQSKGTLGQGCWNLVPSPNPGPVYSSLGHVVVIASDDVWAVGDYYDNVAGAFRSLFMHWDGSQWSVVPGPSPGTYRGFSDITAVSTSDVWVVGQFSDGSGGNRTLTMHWDGSQWSIIPSPNPRVGGDNYLHGVDAVSSDDVWAVGRYFPASGGIHTLTMHWDGTQWTVVPSPNPVPDEWSNELTDVTAISSDDVWAVGGYYSDGASTLTMHWDGTQWSIVPSPNPISNDIISLYSVDCTMSNDVWTVGFYRDTSGVLQPLTMHWDGTSWSIVPGPHVGSTSNRLYSVSTVSSNNVWAAGYYFERTTGYWRALTLHWDGDGWSVVSNPNPSGDEYLSGIDATASGDVWTVGLHSTVGTYRTLVEQYSGLCPNPTATPSPTATATRTPVTTPTATPSCPPGWGIVSSPNNWANDNVLNDVAAIAPNDVWAVGENSGTKLILHWDDTQWNIVSSPSPGPGRSYLNGVVAISANDVWAVGYYGDGFDTPYRTLTMRWDGATWDIIPSPNTEPLNNYLYAVDASSSTDVWAVGGCCNGPRFQMLSIHWDGSRWSIVTTPNLEPSSVSLAAVTAISPNDVWSATDTGLLMHWNGNAWSIVDSPGGPFSNDLEDIDAVSSYDVWVVGSYTIPLPRSRRRFQTLVTHWDGKTWSVIPSPNVGTADSFLRGVDAISANDVWAVGHHAGGSTEQSLTMHWNGAQWTIVPSPNSGSHVNRLNKVAAVSTDDVWAVGYYNHHSAPRRTLVERYTERCPCTIQFTDVDQTNPFYAFIRCLACRGIVGGYQDGTFRPNNNVTRGQLSKIIASAATFNEPVPPGQQSFEDVPPGSTFWQWIERLYYRKIISGYPCGGIGESCVPPNNRPYFRPDANATRGQIAKIASSAADFREHVPPNQQTFQDVPPSHTFWEWIERLSGRGIIGGYPCGGAVEPCVPPSNRPYFRPANNTTRGQLAKIAANTFFPGCEPP